MNNNFLKLSILFLAIIILSLLFKRNTNEYFTFRRPTPDSKGDCRVNGVYNGNWWSSGNLCYQICPSNSQKRDSSGRCICNLGGDNQSCRSGLVCKDNACQEDISTTTMARTTTTSEPNVRPTPDSNGKCQVNGVRKNNWWSSGNTCYQVCPSNSQQRDSLGRCICDKGGDNQSCGSGLVCKDNACQEDISTTTTSTTTMAPTTTTTTMAPTTTTTTMAPTTTTTMAPTTTTTMTPTTTTTTMAPTTTSVQTTTMAPVEQSQTISTTTTYLEDIIDNSPFSLKNMSGSNMDNSNHGKVDGSATKIQKTFSSSNGIPIGDSTPITQSNIPLGMPEVHDTISKLNGRQGNIDMDLIHNPTDIDLNVGYNNY